MFSCMWCFVCSLVVEASSVAAAPGGPDPETGAVLLHAPEGSPEPPGPAWVLPQAWH